MKTENGGEKKKMGETERITKPRRKRRDTLNFNGERKRKGI